jgi:hypothetical protein
VRLLTRLVFTSGFGVFYRLFFENGRLHKDQEPEGRHSGMSK